MALLEVYDIRRCFGGVVALDQVSFSVEQGQIKSLIGPNGAGKTTLFNVVSGVQKPNAGRVIFQGRAIHGLKPFQVARSGIARTFQNPSLFLRMSVLENVMVGRHSRSRCGFLSCSLRLPRHAREERGMREAAMKWIGFVGLGAMANASAGSLSFGQRRMVELARALASEPTLLLLDEPASGLNTRETEDLETLVRSIRDLGITVLLVEHDMSMVMALSDDIVVLHDGRRIAQGPPSAIQNDAHVISVYLGGDMQDAPTG